MKTVERMAAENPLEAEIAALEGRLGLEARRSPVVITERKDHLNSMAQRLSKFAKNVIILRG